MTRINDYRRYIPSGFSDSYWGEINTPEDVEMQFKKTENILSYYENSNSEGYIDDVKDRTLEINKCIVAGRKAATLLSEVSYQRNDFDNISKEQFDEWFNALDDFRARNGELNSRFISRPEM